jgi:hypothetical protein
MHPVRGPAEWKQATRTMRARPGSHGADRSSVRTGAGPVPAGKRVPMAGMAVDLCLIAWCGHIYRVVAHCKSRAAPGR